MQYKKERYRVHRMKWKHGQIRGIYYPGMGQNKIKEIKME
jgi:hypothetical protein